MNCQQCREELYPENPEVSQWDRWQKRYLPPVCQFCNMPRQAVTLPSVATIEPVNDSLYKSKLHEHLVRMNDLEARLNQHIDMGKRKQRGKVKFKNVGIEL